MMFPSRLPHYLLPAAAGASAGFRKPLYFIRHDNQGSWVAARHAHGPPPPPPLSPAALRTTRRCPSPSASPTPLQTTRPPRSTGYGAAVALQAVSAIASGRFAAADALGRTHLAALAAYGVRLAGFVLWRDNLPSYQVG
jgi:hypothetical protein